MAKRTIIWLNSAKQERKEIFNYWNERNKSVRFSKKLQQAITRSYSLINNTPERFKYLGSKGMRYILIAKNYFLVFTFTDTQIITHAFWDARQNPDKLSKRIK